MGTASRKGFSLVELLVVIAIIGLLIGLLLPAVQMARESARNTDCKNRMKQLALATLLHHDAHGYFPPARYAGFPGSSEDTTCGAASPTWLVHVLPYIEQSAAHDHWNVRAAWHTHSEVARTTAPDVFFCPTRRAGANRLGATQIYRSASSTETVQEFAPCGCPYNTVADLQQGSVVNVQGALSDYAGNHGDLSPGANGAPTDFYNGGNGSGVIIGVRPECQFGTPTGPRDRVRLRQVSDGTSNTFLMGEKYIPADDLTQLPYDSPAYDGDNLSASARLAGPGLRLAVSSTDVLATIFSFGSWHPQTVNFAMVDGSVRSLSTETETQTLGSLANRLDARVVELEK